jgi:hypothetical protein
VKGDRDGVSEERDRGEQGSFARTSDDIDQSIDLIIGNAALLMRFFELQAANENSNRRVDFGGEFGEDFSRAVSKLAEAIAKEGEVVRAAAGLLRTLQREGLEDA